MRRILSIVILALPGIILAYYLRDVVPYDMHGGFFFSTSPFLALMNGIMAYLIKRYEDLRKVEGLDKWREEKLQRQIDQRRPWIIIKTVIGFLCSIAVSILGYILKGTDPKIFHVKLTYSCYGLYSISLFIWLMMLYEWHVVTTLQNTIEDRAKAAREKSRQLFEIKP